MRVRSPPEGVRLRRGLLPLLGSGWPCPGGPCAPSRLSFPAVMILCPHPLGSTAPSLSHSNTPDIQPHTP
eukprot:1093577-Rhodomonas_salina.1